MSHLRFENVIKCASSVVIFGIEKKLSVTLNIFMVIWKLNVYDTRYSCVK